MSKKTRNIILGVVGGLVVVTVFVVMLLSERVRLNEGFVTGNTAEFE